MSNTKKMIHVLNKNELNDINLKGPKIFYSELYNYKYVYDNIKLNDYIGFCQYRRYFDFIFNDFNINDIFNNCDIIAGEKISFPFSVKTQYKSCHNIDDLNIVIDIIKNDFNEYYNDFIKFLDQNILYCHNMFIMKSNDFKKYCNFIFNVLEKYLYNINYDVINRVKNNINKYHNNLDNKQYRIGGFLGERLTSFYIMNNFNKIYVYETKLKFFRNL